MRPKQILVVDDNSLSRKLLTDILSAENYCVRDAVSGVDALNAIAQERPDIILLDIMMPGMDGFEVVRRLKADPSTRATPIIAVTALDDHGSRARLASAGVDIMLPKPIDRWKLSLLLSQIFSDSAEDTHE
jgi:CheY-like chemotaxis protein